MRWFLLLFAALVATPPPASADEAGPSPVLVELYTSQGCSACPPADAFLADLAGQSGVIALSLHVDYWDYLGWEDSFARAAAGERQRAYRAALGTRMVYTPQMIVQGRAEAVGSDRAAVEALIAKLRPEAGRGVLAIDASNGLVTGRAEPDGGPGGVLWAAVYDRFRTAEIARGENAGRTIRYANVVRSLMRLGPWAGETVREIGLPHPRDGAGIVFWLQEEGPGPVRAVVRAEF